MDFPLEELLSFFALLGSYVLGALIMTRLIIAEWLKINGLLKKKT